MTFSSKRRILNKNLSLLADNDDISVRDIVRDMAWAVEELQLAQVASRITDDSGYPKDQQTCEVMRGQFLTLTQTAASPNVVTARHGLGRVPQGAIFVRQPAIAQVFIEGRSTGTEIAPATNTEVSFELKGNSGDIYCCILF